MIPCSFFFFLLWNYKGKDWNNGQGTFSLGVFFTSLIFYVTICFSKTPFAVLVHLHIVVLLLYLSKQASSLWD